MILVFMVDRFDSEYVSEIIINLALSLISSFLSKYAHRFFILKF